MLEIDLARPEAALDVSQHGGIRAKWKVEVGSEAVRNINEKPALNLRHTFAFAGEDMLFRVPFHSFQLMKALQQMEVRADDFRSSRGFVERYNPAALWREC